MKILHTSDWHLGHALYGYDRTEEQQAMLDQMAAIVGEEQPDVFVLAGDVYHTAQPSAAVQTMFANALLRIQEACPSMAIVMTAGNHDSGSKHEIFRLPWQRLGVYAVGGLDREAEGHLVEVKDKGFVVAVPYVNERNMPEGFCQDLLRRVEERNTEGLPVVLTAHTTVLGCDSAGHDFATELTVGGIDAMALEDFGDGYDYLALGHIHRAQFVSRGEKTARYSGTPLAVSFDENYPHTVSVVEIGRHGDEPQVREIEIVNPLPLVTLPTEGFASWEESKAELAQFPPDIRAYIRLNVRIDDFLPVEANFEAQELTRDKECRFCHINVSREAARQADGERVMTVQEFQSESPEDIARRYAEDMGVDFDEELQELFGEVVALVNDDLRNT